MKTTIEIPDTLLRRAKATAARQGRTMKEFFIEALTEKLASAKKEGTISGWRAVLGTLGPEAREAARAVDRVIQSADFSRV